MKKFIDKLIGRLEEYKKQWIDADYLDGIDEIIEIVNELAEEYINCSTDISTNKSDTSTISKMENVGWIPCSINKHNEIHVAEKMWVTMRNKESKYRFVRRLMWNGCLRRWEWDNGKPISDMWEVVAWKKIDVPAPYTEGE